MKFWADESVDRQIVDRLREDGHQVWYAAEMEPGLSDEAVLASANEATAILLTADKDFGELIFRQRLYTHGVVLIRLAGLSPSRKADVVASAVRQYGREILHAFAVITPGVLRVRRLQK